METIIQNIFIDIFGQNPLIITFFISMMPIIELKGALPFGMSEVWNSPLSPITSLSVCVLGGMIMSGLLIFVLHRLLPTIKNNDRYKSFFYKYKDKATTLSHAKSDLKRLLLLAFFTLVPLPLTGYYTSCLIAELVGLRPFDSWCFINIGNLLSGVIILLLSLLSNTLLKIFLYTFFGLFLVYGSYLIISFTLKLTNNFAKK